MSYKTNSVGSVNNIINKYQDPVPYPQDTSGANLINAGDLVWYDTSNHWIAALDTDAHAAEYAGVAMNGSNLAVYTTAFYGAQIPVLTKGIVGLFGTSGDTYHDGDSVYQTTSASGTPQTITNTAGANTHVLGTIVLPPGITSSAYAAGTRYQVKISPLWPVTMAA